MNTYSEKADSLLNTLATDPEKGLKLEEAKARLGEYGPNKLREKKKKNIAQKFFDQFKDAMILILIAAAIISFVIVCVEKNCGELFEPEYFLYELEKELERGADAVCCTHVSNVFGYILPIERVDELCARYGVPLIIDASQSAGSVPLNCSEFKAAQFVGMPGHKGLLGPQGTGILLCLADKGEPIMFGGTGADSKNRYMPEYLPERLEAGTQNVHGIAGLAEGIKTIKNLGVENIARYYILPIVF